MITNIRGEGIRQSWTCLWVEKQQPKEPGILQILQERGNNGYVKFWRKVVGWESSGKEGEVIYGKEEQGSEKNSDGKDGRYNLARPPWFLYRRVGHLLRWGSLWDQELQESRKNWKSCYKTPCRKSGKAKNIILSRDAGENIILPRRVSWESRQWHLPGSRNDKADMKDQVAKGFWDADVIEVARPGTRACETLRGLINWDPERVGLLQQPSSVPHISHLIQKLPPDHGTSWVCIPSCPGEITGLGEWPLFARSALS